MTFGMGSGSSEEPAAAGAASTRPILELTGISKRFGDFYANTNVNFDLREGEIHCLVGENGAGCTPGPYCTGAVICAGN